MASAHRQINVDVQYSDNRKIRLTDTDNYVESGILIKIFQTQILIQILKRGIAAIYPSFSPTKINNLRTTYTNISNKNDIYLKSAWLYRGMFN